MDEENIATICPHNISLIRSWNQNTPKWLFLQWTLKSFKHKEINLAESAR
jgi:hypothetical protein